jgi:hypothetical protein
MAREGHLRFPSLASLSSLHRPLQRALASWWSSSPQPIAARSLPLARSIATGSAQPLCRWLCSSTAPMPGCSAPNSKSCLDHHPATRLNPTGAIQCPQAPLCVKDVNLSRPRARGTVCPGLLFGPAIVVSFRRYRSEGTTRKREWTLSSSLHGVAGRRTSRESSISPLRRHRHSQTDDDGLPVGGPDRR